MPSKPTAPGDEPKKIAEEPDERDEIGVGGAVAAGQVSPLEAADKPAPLSALVS